MKSFKILLYVILLTQLCISPLTTFAASAAETITYTTNSATPYVNDIEWQYKMINGILHKRLYNFSTNTPITDWEPVT